MRGLICCGPIACVLIAAIFVIEVSSDAVFELSLKNFVNKGGKDFEGHCCSGFKSRSGGCVTPCKTKFRVCLNVYQEKIDPKSACTFGEYLTPVLGENELDFSRNNLPGFANPVRFPMPSWQGTFSLIIEALHEVKNNTANAAAASVLIDRLMTQQWLDIGDDWTSNTHTTSHHSLSYEYRVTCKDHYFGASCGKWCKPRDDNFGHYDCNSAGDIQCLVGWQGINNYCINPICSADCKGTCDRPNECKCHNGWKGDKCDQCIVYPGCLRGSCDKPWQCNCDEGWGGLFCNQDLNYCTNHGPCKNGATCFNTEPGSYSCKCPTGFTGTNCEIVNNTCATTQCQNKGRCLDTGDSNFVCQCPHGFTGQYCEIAGQSCNERPCMNGATCRDTQGSYQCHCSSGYEGANCERPVNECASAPCLNGGSCVDEHNSFQCVCPNGYTGPKCEVNIDDCATRPCLNSGTCLDGLDSFTCQCVPGFIGPLCQTNVNDCSTRPCANGGTCLDSVNDFECRCRSGWAGRQCTERVPMPPSPCEMNPCKNYGQCQDAPELAVGYRCACLLGYGGPRCNVVVGTYMQEELTAAGPMSPAQVVLIVTFSIAVPVLAVVSALAIICMKRRRLAEQRRLDEEARRQNEQNTVHNAVNAVNNKCLLEDHMIFNSLDYPAKPINIDHNLADHSYLQQRPLQDSCDFVKNAKGKSLENAYGVAPARSTKTLNTDVSRSSLADRLEKDLERGTPISYRGTPMSFMATPISYRGTPNSELNNSCQVTDHQLNHSQSDSYLKRVSCLVPGQGGTVPDLHTSTHTLGSAYTPSTCTTPSSVYVIEEHYDDSYIATEV